MDLNTTQALVSSLLLNISSISGYPIPVKPPDVFRIGAAQVQERVCSKPCRARAFFSPG